MLINLVISILKLDPSDIFLTIRTQLIYELVDTWLGHVEVMIPCGVDWEIYPLTPNVSCDVKVFCPSNLRCYRGVLGGAMPNQS